MDKLAPASEPAASAHIAGHCPARFPGEPDWEQVAAEHPAHLFGAVAKKRAGNSLAGDHCHKAFSVR